MTTQIKFTAAPTPELLSISSLSPASASASASAPKQIIKDKQAGLGDATEAKRYRLHRRFDRLGRLYGDSSVETLMNAKVAVFGLGGVGSFAAEALSRSAVGHLMLVDFDDICVTNCNRQLQALKGNIGHAKSTVLAERCRLINPQAQVSEKQLFYNKERSAELLANPWDGGKFDYVLDCIDNMTAKAHLLASCRAQGVAVISSMGAAGKSDPTQIRTADIADVTVCTLARELRKILRKHHQFPAFTKEDAPFGIEAVYSTESRTWPRELSYDGGKGFVCVCPHKSDEHGCDSRSLIDGTAVFVTGSFGLTMASVVVNSLTAMCAAATKNAEKPAMDKHGVRQKTPISVP